MPITHPAWTRSLLIALLLLPAVTPAAAGQRSIKKEMRFAVDLARKGLWNEAEFRFRRLLERDPSSFKLWNNLAVACEAVRDYPCADEAYRKADSLMSPTAEPVVLNKEAFDAFYRAWTAHRSPPDPPSAPGTETSRPDDGSPSAGEGNGAAGGDEAAGGDGPAAGGQQPAAGGAPRR